MLDAVSGIEAQSMGFMAGRFDYVDRAFATPLPVFHEDATVVLTTRAAIRAAVETHRRAVADAGVEALEAEVVDSRHIDACRASYDVRIIYRGPDGVSRRGLSTYYIETRSDRARIAMIEIREQALAASLPKAKRAATAPGAYV